MLHFYTATALIQHESNGDVLYVERLGVGCLSKLRRGMGSRLNLEENTDPFRRNIFPVLDTNSSWLERKAIAGVHGAIASQDMRKLVSVKYRMCDQKTSP